jgi:hypothetical protein
MCTTPERASKFGFPASYHAFKFQPQLHGADLDNLFSYIWARDTQSFDHSHHRLQVAFSILIFYLGLHPNIALKEGLYYRNRKIFLTQYKSCVRAILIIRLHDRDENARAAQAWSR